jgi:hypothetical protein
MVTAPLSSSQIIDVPVTFACITPTCKDLNSVLLALDAKLECEKPDYTTLDFGCVPEADTELGVLQNILDNISCTTPTSTVVPDAPLTGITYCSTDHWNCGAPDACLTVTNPQNPGVITLKILLQAMINREVALGNTVLSLCSRISALEATVAAQQLTITTIQTSCCG